MMARLAARLGVTEGHAYTLGIGLLFAIVLMVIGLPPVLRDGAPPLAAAPSSLRDSLGTEFDTVVPPTTTPTTSPRLLVDPPALPPPRRTTTTVAPTTTPPSIARPTADAPLQVLVGRWSSSSETAATGHPTVPDDGLPVGALAGRDDTRSYVRLVGLGVTLVLPLVDEPGAQQVPEAAAIRACPITEPLWSVRDGDSHESAPAFDTDRCVDGTVDDEGSWRFDLSTFSDDERTSSAGFALVPGQTTVPFQVVLSRAS